MTRAAVDVGTNSVRLLVIDGQGATLDRQVTITRLGRGVDDRGRLDDEALRRTLDTIERYRDAWEAYSVTSDRVRIAATSAVRDAADRERFFDEVRARTGVDAQVLSGQEEARITFVGVRGALEVDASVAVLDIGGGSTEVVVGEPEGPPRGSVSLQLGSVRLTERLLVADPPGPGQVDAARAEVRRQLEHADEELLDRGGSVRDVAQLVGVAGTVTTLAALDLRLERYEADAVHGHVLDRDAVSRLTQQLLALPAGQRAELGPVQPGREDVIHGGAVILDEALAHYDLPAIVVSEADILDGLARTAGADGA